MGGMGTETNGKNSQQESGEKPSPTGQPFSTYYPLLNF